MIESPHHARVGWVGLITSSAVLAALTAAVALHAAPALALPPCTVAGLSALGVPAVTVASAVDVPASPANPEYCDVRGTVTTTGYGAPSGLAQFEVQLPATWSGRFLFFGVGGTAGSTYADFAGNPVDYFQALFKGYATAITDTGHQAGNTDAAWAITAPHVADSAKVADYYFRATHQVTLAGKALAQKYYGAGSIRRAYFDGCSNGGRQAMVEATHFPEDYDGVIAGAPFMDIRAIIQGAKQEKAMLLSADSYIPYTLLPLIDKAVYASCDAADGVKDGLIQNPAKCAFDPASMVCASPSATGCLTPNQARTLRSYTSALRSEEGRLIYPGASVTDLAGGMDAWTTGFVPPSDFAAAEPWGGTGFSPAPAVWQFTDHIIKYLVERDPGFNVRSFPESPGGFIGEGALSLFDARTEAGDGDRPEHLLPFIYQNRKLLMYHGFSDPALPPFRTVKFYEDLADARGGYAELQENVRLFMVPGMQHCGGGPGPNVFDTLTAMEKWSESGMAPDGLLATHSTSGTVDRSMPLCKFPEQARYDGKSNVNVASSWSCTSNKGLLELGPDGVRAGLGGDGHEGDE